ncbi:MAG: citrate lyase acyl carrier protein [Synergistaceae bacterium]|nr:citrate lyase acyl carrier protein [Synergistaceae bacterium]
MSAEEHPRTAQAGTIESMDCLVTIAVSAGGRIIEITGASAAMFGSAMTAKINQTLDELERSVGVGKETVKVTVQDNGALDLVLGARVEAAYRRYFGGAGA